MNARLLRALQKGGCAAKTRPDEWAVWRTSDRRGRAIGTLETKTIDRLRLSKHLAPLGTYEDGRLVWTGAAEPVAVCRASPKAIMAPKGGETVRRLPLLFRILEGRSDPKERERLLQAARDFSEDMERAMCSGRAAGMNWQGIASGTAIQGGRRGASGLERISYAARAEHRLDQIATELGHKTMRVLERLILDGVTRHAMSNVLSMKPAQTQNYCADAIRRLADAYDQATRRPERATRRSA